MITHCFGVGESQALAAALHELRRTLLPMPQPQVRAPSRPQQCCSKMS